MSNEDLILVQIVKTLSKRCQLISCSNSHMAILVFIALQIFIVTCVHNHFYFLLNMFILQ
jgi:hypothetical protein